MQKWELFSSQKSGLVWPEQPSAALTAICIFKVLFQAPLGQFFFLVCTVYWIWEEVLQHHCCLCIVVQEQQATRSERYMQGFRKEQFSACKDARIGTWKLCRNWRLFGCFCASLLPPSSPPHQGILRLFSLAGLRRIWKSQHPQAVGFYASGKGNREDCSWLWSVRSLIFLSDLKA